MTPDDIVAAALAHDPAVVAAAAEVAVAQGQVDASRGLRENPRLDARLGFGLSQHEVSLSQPVSLSGEGLAALAAARADVDAAQARLERRRFEVATAARRSLVRAIQADASLALLTDAFSLARELRSATEAKLAVGEVAGLDVHLARLAEASAAADVVAATRVAREARVALASTTGVGDEVALPTDPFVAVPVEAPATGARSDLRAAEAAVSGARLAVRWERASVLPPVEIGVWAQVQNVAASGGPSGVEIPPWSWSQNAAWTVGPSFGMTLPVWKQNPAGRAEADAGLTAAEAELTSAGARIAAEQAGSEARRAAMALLTDTADPTTEARAVLAAVGEGVAAGELGVAEATILRAQALDSWRRAQAARAEAAEAALDVALAEEWSTLLGAP